ncbi:hypothetical protein AX16_005573 [Volvariella volvacea WC 439]|nr:hypothetical protein AX16_005573 [Volvariella volvacea WC 439]
MPTSRSELAIMSAYSSPVPTSSLPPVVCEGWVLKKRRKKMQGFARRYFVLHNTGLLTYSFEPEQPVRDQILLYNAAISTAPGRKDIHVDSNTATFHLKCLSTEDFEKWMTAFRKFIALGAELRRSASVRHASKQGTASLTKSSALIEEIGGTIAELDAAFKLIEPPVPKKLPSKKSEKEKHKDHAKEGPSVFGGLFKRGHGPSLDSTHGESDYARVPYYRLETAISILKEQHAALVQSMRGAEPGTSAYGSPHPMLPTTNEEPEDEVPRGDPHTRLATPKTKQSRQTSIATTASDLSEWFDALDSMGDGPQEFVMEPQMVEGADQATRTLSSDSRSSLDHDSAPSVETDAENAEQTPATLVSIEENHKPAALLHVVRRTQLPAHPVGDEGSLFAILKKNIGKDLSAIAFPVTFNEPLTLLQRIAEEFEYYDLLSQAAATTDPVERICYVAAFAVSGYTHTRHRSGRKGFNPMLGETFEDARMKFIAEKVRHQPLEMACHAEGPGWELTATSAGKTKFWGKSLEIIPLGTTHLKISNDHYVWNKPSSFMRNLMVGTKYLEHCGKMTIENRTDSTRCVLDFKQNGYWAASNVVSGIVYDQSGQEACHLEGKWDDQFALALDSSHFRVLWRATPFPKSTHEYYGFTSFGITLNEITPDLVGKLPSTDSRLRPDVRALEEGDLDKAEQEKVRVEELQRERRRQGKDRQPRWFRQAGDEWEYVGGYWEARERNWQGQPSEPLW